MLLLPGKGAYARSKGSEEGPTAPERAKEFLKAGNANTSFHAGRNGEEFSPVPGGVPYPDARGRRVPASFGDAVILICRLVDGILRKKIFFLKTNKYQLRFKRAFAKPLPVLIPANARFPVLRSPFSKTPRSGIF